jgi:hypothetical protein
MRPLTAQDILQVWERGQDAHPLDRALHILSPALPSAGWDSLARLTVGRRNAALFRLRRATFGPALSARAACPRCAALLEFEADARDFCDADEAREVAPEHELSVGEFRLRFRPFDSRDLAEAALCRDRERARATLIDHCLLEARGSDEPMRASDLPAAVVAALADRAAECDPHAETLLGLDCHACGRHWTALFDIASFFWREIAAEAMRLLLAVHALAAAYGWRESEVLSMSAARRQMYLEMIS